MSIPASTLAGCSRRPTGSYDRLRGAVRSTVDDDVHYAGVMPFADLVRGVCLRVPPGALDRTTAQRFGRALATLLARRGDARAPVVVARGDDEDQRALRDGIVRGLVLSGVDVLDLGIVDSELFAFALRAGHRGAACAAGVLLGSTGDATSAMTFLGLAPTSSDTLHELAELADAGAFVVGQGTVEFPDLRAAFRAEPTGFDIDIDHTNDDTREGSAL